MNTRPALARALSQSLSSKWIISRQMDLTWLIGGALAGYALFFMHAGLGWDMVGIWFLWVVFLDSPHFFGTISRTYLDRQEFTARRRLLLGSLLWFLAGPFALVLAYLVYAAGSEHYTLPWTLFLVMFRLWAYWHIVRQHYGFMKLYQKKNGETDRADARLDSTLLYSGLLLPFAVFIARHPIPREQFGLAAEMPAYPALPEGGRLLAPFDPGYLQALAWEHWLVAISAAFVGTVVLLFLARQLVRLTMGESLNLPKILFLSAVVPLHVYVCFSDAVLTADLLAFSAFITIFHDIQYHAIVWFHHRNRYHRPNVDQKQFGLAPKISKNLLVYATCAVGFAFIFRLLGCTLNIHPGCAPLLITSDIQLFGTLNTDSLLKAFLLGFPLHHYFVDQFIWKTSKSKDLKRDLALDDRVADRRAD